MNETTNEAIGNSGIALNNLTDQQNLLLTQLSYVSDTLESLAGYTIEEILGKLRLKLRETRIY